MKFNGEVIKVIHHKRVMNDVFGKRPLCPICKENHISKKGTTGFCHECAVRIALTNKWKNYRKTKKNK